MEKIFPIVSALKNYSSSLFKSDLNAGLVSGTILIPQGMAYAMIAGLPPVYGLYTAIFPLLIYSLFGSSRQLAIGPVAMDSLLVATGISTIVAIGENNYVMIAVFLAFLVGVIQVFLGIFRLGFLTNFLSRPVITGFTSAVAIMIGLGQLKHIIGVKVSNSKYLHQLTINLFQQLGELHLYTLLVGGSAIIFLVLAKKVKIKIPFLMVIVILGVGFSYFLDFESNGVTVVGFIPKGIPKIAFHWLDYSLIKQVLPVAATLAVIGFLEAYSLSKTLLVKHKNEYKLEANRELFALGMSNMIGSFFSTYPVSGSFSRTAVHDQAGAKTTLALVFSAGIVAFALAFLTDWFYFLPNSVLAAIIIVAVVKLVDVKEFKYLWKTDRSDFSMLLASFLGTLLLGVEWGVVLGVTLSLAVLIYKTAVPHMAELAKVKGSKYYKNIDRFSEVDHNPDVGILRFDARLYFANVGALMERVEQMMLKNSEMKVFILDGQSITDVDSTGLRTLLDIHTLCESNSIGFKIVSLIGPVRDKLQSTGIVDVIGIDNFQESIALALSAESDREFPFQTNN
ncbi:MAG: sulfate permease [Reichenbachiella sp.]